MIHLQNFKNHLPFISQPAVHKSDGKSPAWPNGKEILIRTAVAFAALEAGRIFTSPSLCSNSLQNPLVGVACFLTDTIAQLGSVLGAAAVGIYECRRSGMAIEALNVDEFIQSPVPSTRIMKSLLLSSKAVIEKSAGRLEILTKKDPEGETLLSRGLIEASDGIMRPLILSDVKILARVWPKQELISILLRDFKDSSSTWQTSSMWEVQCSLLEDLLTEGYLKPEDFTAEHKVRLWILRKEKTMKLVETLDCKEAVIQAYLTDDRKAFSPRNSFRSRMSFDQHKSVSELLLKRFGHSVDSKVQNPLTPQEEALVQAFMAPTSECDSCNFMYSISLDEKLIQELVARKADFAKKDRVGQTLLDHIEKDMYREEKYRDGSSLNGTNPGSTPLSRFFLIFDSLSEEEKQSLLSKMCLPEAVASMVFSGKAKCSDWPPDTQCKLWSRALLDKKSIDKLKQAGFDPNVRNKEGYTPLLQEALACYKKDVSTFDHLIEAGANISATVSIDGVEKNALQLALESKVPHPELIALLQKHIPSEIPAKAE